MKARNLSPVGPPAGLSGARSSFGMMAADAPQTGLLGPERRAIAEYGRGLALALAPKGNRMLPGVLDFEGVLHEGGFSRLLLGWEPAALDCDDAFRIPRDFLALSNPTPDQCERATQEFVDDSEGMNGVLWDFVHDHREAVAGL